MGYYRKKPAVIEAFKYCYERFPDWMPFIEPNQHDGSILIRTLEGNMRAYPGDYIIKGVKGEIYPCRSDIFEETYKPVSISNLKITKTPSTIQ